MGLPSSKKAARLRRLTFAALVLLLFAAVSGCGSSSGSGASGGSGAGKGGPSAAAAADAKRVVAQFEAAPTWRGPATPVRGLARERGKLIVCVSSNFAVPFLKAMCDDSAAALTQAGFHVQEVDGKGDPSNYNDAIRQAVSQHAAGIVLISVSPDIVHPALVAAKQAGTKVVLAADQPIDYQPPPEVGANVTVDYNEVGVLQVDYAVATTKGPIHAYGFWGAGFPSEVAQRDGRDRELKRICPGCTLSEQSVLISDFPRTIPPVVESQIRQNPDLNWFLPTFDGLDLYVVPAVTQAGALGRVRSSSHNAIEGNLRFILNGDVQVMSVGENTEWWAWGAADALIRQIVGQPVEPENIPLRVFDKQVLQQIGTNKLGDQDALYGNVDYRGDYRKLWGLG